MPADPVRCTDRPDDGGNAWSCVIGESNATRPMGSDGPMRDAVEKAYRFVTGEDPTFCFSGWGAKLDEAHRAVVEDRLPDIDVQIAEAREHLAMLLAVKGAPMPDRLDDATLDRKAHV